MSYNKIILIGNVGRDPELRYTPQGTPVCNFSLAVNSKYGEKEETLWMGIVVFGKQAESAAQYLGKGSQCLVEGRLTEKTWEKDGEKKSKMEVIANNVRFLGGKKEGNKNTSDGSTMEAPPEEVTGLEPF